MFKFHPISDTSTYHHCLYFQMAMPAEKLLIVLLISKLCWGNTFKMPKLIYCTTVTFSSKMPIIPSAQKRFPPLSLFSISFFLYSHNPIWAQLFVSLVIICCAATKCRSPESWGHPDDQMNLSPECILLSIYLFIYQQLIWHISLLLTPIMTASHRHNTEI